MGPDWWARGNENDTEKGSSHMHSCDRANQIAFFPRSGPECTGPRSSYCGIDDVWRVACASLHIRAAAQLLWLNGTGHQSSTTT